MKLLVGFFLLLSIGFCNSLNADSYSDRSDQLARAAGNTWEQEIRPKFENVMSQAELSNLNSIDFRFIAGGGAYDAFAGLRHGRKIIVISGAFVAFQDAALDAFVMSDHFGMRDRFLSYLDFATERGLENTARWRAHERLEPVPGFALYAHLNMSAAASFFSSDEYQSKMLSGRIESLAYVLGHEIGHHYNNNYGITADDEQRRRESEADKYSMRLILRAGFSPLAAIPLMMFFNEAGGDSRHPPPMCRMINFMQEALPPLLRDEKFRAYGRAHPDDYRAVLGMAPFVKQHQSDIVSFCGDWVLAPN